MDLFKIGFIPIGGKKEEKTFEILVVLSKTVVKCVEKFRDGVNEFSKNNLEKGREILSEVEKLESEADEHNFKFKSRLGGGAFLPTYRGDLSKLSESIDDIADVAERSIREINRRPRVFEDLKKAEKKNEKAEFLRLGLVDLAEKAVKSTRALDKATSVLMKNMDEAAKRAEGIHKREQESDRKENELAMELYKHEDLLNPITVMQIKELIKSFGQISDAAEDSGNILSAMVYSIKA